MHFGFANKAKPIECLGLYFHMRLSFVFKSSKQLKFENEVKADTQSLPLIGELASDLGHVSRPSFFSTLSRLSR